MPSLPPILPARFNRTDPYYYPEGKARDMIRTCKLRLLKFLPHSFFSDTRRELEVDQMLYEEEVMQFRSSERHMTNDTQVKQDKPVNVLASENDKAFQKCSIAPKKRIRFHTARGIKRCGQSSRNAGVAEALNPISPMEKTVRPSVVCKNVCKIADQVVPSLPTTEPLQKPECDMENREITKTSTCSNRDTKENPGSKKEKDDGKAEIVERKEKSKISNGESISANLKTLVDDILEQSTSERTPEVVSSTPDNIQGKEKRVFFAKENSAQRNAAAYYHLDPYYSGQDPIQPNIYTQHPGIPEIKPGCPTTQLQNIPLPSIQVPSHIAKMWGVKEEGRTPNLWTNQGGPSHAPVTDTKSPEVPASTPVRRPDNILDELFADMRKFTSDVEETLTVVATHAKKRHDILAEKMRVMEIELRQARQKLDIPLLLQKVAECEKSNAELKKCLQETGEKFANADYRGG